MKIKRTFMTVRMLVLIACLAASISGIGLIAAAQDDSDTTLFETPEDAITFYLEAVIQGDIPGILRATAVNEMSENFDFERFVNRIRGLTIQAPAPSDYPFYVELNKVQFTSQLLGQVRNLTYSLLATEKELVKTGFVRMETDGAIQFMGEVDPERLAELQVLEIGIPLPDLASSERNQENWNIWAQIYRADEFAERVVLLEFEGETYFMGFGILRYGENWKISTASSALGGTDATGAPAPTTADDFQDLIRGE